MFTGLIEQIGKIEDIQRTGEGAELEISCPDMLRELTRGCSVAVDGVCLTVKSLTSSGFIADLSSETLERSTLGKASRGTEVNLEPALRADSRLGGHFVQGHVDGAGKLLRRSPAGGGRLMSFTFPPGLAKFLVEKGSVAVNGVSLTIAGLEPESFEVAVIPHTLNSTTLKNLREGDEVNIEVDILGKYVVRALEMREDDSKIDMEFLSKHGFTD